MTKKELTPKQHFMFVIIYLVLTLGLLAGGILSVVKDINPIISGAFFVFILYFLFQFIKELRAYKRSK